MSSVYLAGMYDFAALPKAKIVGMGQVYETL